jgi:predicted metal-binding membrane protein
MQGVKRPSALALRVDRGRWLVIGPLLIVVTLCWSWIVPVARDMYGPMTGPAAWMMTARWDWPHLALLFAMWFAMMVGMMLPSALPTSLLYGRIIRSDSAAPHAAIRVYAFVGGYVFVWGLFSIGATIAQRVLSESLLLTPMMEPATPALAVGLLLAAGAYQLLPIKRACLASCRLRVEPVVRHRYPGVAEAFRAGTEYGRSCLGCNWLLMLLLFAGGVMNLAVIAALTVIVLLEKVAPFGMRTPLVSGGLLVALALWILAR